MTDDRHTCACCGRVFTTDASMTSCAGCKMFGSGGCRMLRCPHCGYEMPPPARLPKLLANLARSLMRKKEPDGHPHGG